MTALITGASGGLGKEFARVYAENGYDLVIVARSEEKLNKIKSDFEKLYKIKVYVIADDLSDDGAAKRIFDRTKELGIEIDELVNNAGCGKMQTVADCDEQTLKDIITLNVTSVTLLSHYFAGDMSKRGHGKIMQVSSLGAFQPDPYFNVYGPTKAFELFLGATMYGELKGTGVTVSVLCPGPVKTNWANNAGKQDSSLAKDPYLIAKIGFEKMRKGRLVVVPTAIYKAERVLVSILPKKAVSRVIGKWQSGLRK